MKPQGIYYKTLYKIVFHANSRFAWANVAALRIVTTATVFLFLVNIYWTLILSSSVDNVPSLYP